MVREQRLPVDARLRRAYINGFCGEIFDFEIKTAVATNHFFCAEIKDSLGKASEAEREWTKAFELFTMPDMEFGIEALNFVNSYIDRQLDLNRLDSWHAAKIVHNTIDFSINEYCRLSFHIIDHFRRAARFCLHAANFAKGLKYMQQCVDICKACVVRGTVNGTSFLAAGTVLSNFVLRLYQKLSQSLGDLGNLHALNRDLQAALTAHRESISVASVAFRIDAIRGPSTDASFRMIFEYQAISQEAIASIVDYPDGAEANKKLERVIRRTLAKKERVAYRRQSLKFREQLVVLLNLTAGKQCGHCKNRTTKLRVCSCCKSAYYCNIKHQKLEWKHHKLKCC